MKKSINKYLTNGLFVVFGIIVLSYILLEVFAPSKTIDILKYKSYIVVSSSMEPDIMINDVIIVHDVKEEDIKNGDVITFSVYLPELDDYNVVTHYVGEIQTNDDNEIIYKTQGAGKEPGEFDEWTDENGVIIDIMFDDVYGEVVLVIPKIGYVINILKDPISIGLLIINGFIIYLLVKTIRMSKRDKKVDN